MALGKAGAIAGAVSQVQVPRVAKPAAALFLLPACACSEKKNVSPCRYFFSAYAGYRSLIKHTIRPTSVKPAFFDYAGERQLLLFAGINAAGLSPATDLQQVLFLA
jgi:hypothetical protein